MNSRTLFHPPPAAGCPEVPDGVRAAPGERAEAGGAGQLAVAAVDVAPAPQPLLGPPGTASGLAALPAFLFQLGTE